MPSDLPAPVDVDDGGAVDGALLGTRALARGVDRGVLQHEARVGDHTRDPAGVDLTLELPRLLVGDVDSEADEREPASPAARDAFLVGLVGALTHGASLTRGHVVSRRGSTRNSFTRPSSSRSIL